MRRFAQQIIAERGVRHGQLNLVSVELGKAHSHGGTVHRHLKPHIKVVVACILLHALIERMAVRRACVAMSLQRCF